MRNLLRDYRKMVYLNNLSEAEYMLFTDQVLASVEAEYPVYTTFIEMPAVNDTVQVYVVTTIVEQLDADASNMRHLYPYRDLVAANILPDGLSRSQQNSFYQCFATAVDNTYSSPLQLVNAILAKYSNFEKSAVLRAIEALGYPETVRGEKLSTADFGKLADLLSE